MYLCILGDGEKFTSTSVGNYLRTEGVSEAESLRGEAGWLAGLFWSRGERWAWTAVCKQ